MSAGNPFRMQRANQPKVFKVTGNAEVAKKVIEQQRRFKKLLDELKGYRDWLFRQIADPDLTLDARTAYQRSLDHFDNKPVSDRHRIVSEPNPELPEE